jgi:Uncharacterized conserved protein
LIEFHAPTVEDKAWATPLLRASGWSGSEYAFGTHYVWQKKFHAEIANYGGFFLGRSDEKYLFPAGEGNLKEVLEELLEQERAQNHAEALNLFAVPQPAIPILQKLFGDRISVEPDRANWDYLYLAENLIALPGKAYHGKRNHVAKFRRTYSYAYEDITSQNAGECLAMAEEWQSANENPADFVDEMEAIRLAFGAWEQLKFSGGLLRTDGKVIAFTAGEEISRQTYDLHFEKALTSFDGAYAAINQEFAARRLSAYSLLNREEDMGMEGLRKAKESYHPTAMFEKNTVMLR